MEPFFASVDVSRESGPNTKFWTAAGLDSLYPLSLTESGEYLMARMQKYDTCRYLRNHHALSRITSNTLRAGGEVYDEDDRGEPVYNFERMNAVYAQYLKYGMKPVVEMDYLPLQLMRRNDVTGGAEEGRRTGRSWPNDWDKWRNLLIAFTRNLVDTFGVDEVRTWYFEVWNEPDNWQVNDWPQFYRLYDVFADAVTGVDDKLRVGGPGTYSLAFLKGFLNHVANGVNYVTGEKGSRIDFISHHIYGVSGGWIDEYPLVTPTVQRFVQELLWIGRTISVFPALRGIPFHLNEWGVSSHYEKNSVDHPALAIRDSEFSALFFIKLVDCIYKIREKFGMDVAMMLYWGFCMEDHFDTVFYGNRSLTTAHRLPKPIQTAHEMLSLLGDRLLCVQGLKSGGTAGVLAARSEAGVQFAAYHFSEYDADGEGPPRRGTVRVTGLASGRYRVRAYLLDRYHHNTYRLWREMGAGRDPNKLDMRALSQAAELTANYDFVADITGGAYECELALPAQSVCVYTIEPV